MARLGPAKPAEQGDWEGRLRNARDFKRDAADLLAVRGDDENANGTLTLIVNAASAYADALTGKFGGFFNQQDHRNAGAAVARALANRADQAQLKRLAAIIAYKDAASYGPRRTHRQKAHDLLEQLERFAAWVEDEMRRG